MTLRTRMCWSRQYDKDQALLTIVQDMLAEDAVLCSRFQMPEGVTTLVT